MLSVLAVWAVTVSAQVWKAPECDRPTTPPPPTLGIPKGEVPINVKPIGAPPEPERPRKALP